MLSEGDAEELPLNIVVFSMDGLFAAGTHLQTPAVAWKELELIT
jgi:hypothetical protein